MHTAVCKVDASYPPSHDKNMSCNNKKKNEAIPSLYCDSVVGKAEDDILSFPASAEGPLPPGQTGRGLGHGGHPELLHPE